jgi:hypothetical protein
MAWIFDRWKVDNRIIMLPTTSDITITEDDPKFFEALENPEGFLPILAEAMANIMTEFVAGVEKPAPESDANAPGRTDRNGRPMGYYERGRGWWYPIRTHNKLGLGRDLPRLGLNARAPHTLGSRALIAKGINGVAGYKLSAVSEQLEENWRADVIQNADEVIGILSNLASYGGYVQGVDQTALHQSREWNTYLDIWESAHMQAVVVDETMKALKTYYNL